MPIGHIFSSRIDPGDGGFLSALQLERGFERVFHNEIQTEREDVYNVKIYSSISDTPLSLSLSALKHVHFSAVSALWYVKEDGKLHLACASSTVRTERGRRKVGVRVLEWLFFPL